MGLTKKQRNAKKAKEMIKLLLSQYNLENHLFFKGFNYSSIVFSTNSHKTGKIIWEKAVRIIDRIETIMFFIDTDDTIIEDNKEREKFIGLEEYRKFLLIKKIAGIK